jgi:hypothetical protein
LTGAAAIAVAVPTAALVAPSVASGDEKLIALERELLAAHSRWGEAWDISNAASERYFAARPKERPVRKPPKEYYDLYATITVGELSRMPDDHPLKIWSEQIDKEHEVRLNDYNAADQKARIETGVKEAESECNQRGHEMWEIGREIWETPASSLAGLLIKVRAAEKLCPDEPIEEAYDGLVADIRALAEHERG